MNDNGLETEWCLLQSQYDSYEKHSLYIKLMSVVVVLTSEVMGGTSLFILLLMAVLWLQDGIWKTFQSRIEFRLLQLENSISEGTAERGYQFNNGFLKTRMSGLALIAEYVRQSIRPTVAFPHIVLVVMYAFKFL